MAIKLDIERIGLTDDFYANLAKTFPRSVPYVSAIRSGKILGTYPYLFTISMVVYKMCRPAVIWWEFSCDIDVDFDIEKFLSAYENYIR